MQHRGTISGFYLEEETLQVVGLHERQIAELVAQLIPQHNPDDDGQSSINEIIKKKDQLDAKYAKVIELVGAGGSGKTTVVRTVYNRVDVKRHFTKRAWVRIPSVFNVRDVFIDILKQINPAVVSVLKPDDSGQSYTIKLLKGFRSLIIFDDVTPQVWESPEMKGLFLSPTEGSKIIIINRGEGSNKPSAYLDENIPTVDTGRLDDEDSWRLFSSKVRIAETELKDPKFITLKEQITNSCGGLPSIIVLLAGLLSTKERSYDAWASALKMLADKEHTPLIKRSGEGYFGNTEDVIVMTLSYQDLPQEVQPCFLYMGLFPRGFDIPVRRLIHLWCAEGFMISSVGMEPDPQDLSEMCLEELVTRKMVQVGWSIDGSPKTCRMHSVFYDFFSSKADNVGFFYHLFRSSQTSQRAQKFAVRRLAAYTGSNDIPSFQHLRSYVAFNNWQNVRPEAKLDHLDIIISNKSFGFPKLLDLEGIYKPKLSDTVIKRLLQLSRSEINFH